MQLFLCNLLFARAVFYDFYHYKQILNGYSMVAAEYAEGGIWLKVKRVKEVKVSCR